MRHKIIWIGLLSLCTLYASAQKQTQEQIDSIAFQVLDQRFKGGQKAFFSFFGRTIVYPSEARETCRSGTLLLSVKIRPSGALDSIQIKNEVEIGAGIENEAIRCLLATKGQWLKATESSTLNFSIGFWIEEEKDRPKASMLVVAFGFSSFCPKYQDLVKAFQKAKKKKDYKEALRLCEELYRRQPLSEEYKTEYADLKSKSN